ncbi:MAG: hypothetical protein KAZ88_11535 [Acidimicrobiia bacterium]|nr:hypothetical protein [Acidimicrobiia bacterium]
MPICASPCHCPSRPPDEVGDTLSAVEAVQAVAPPVETRTIPATSPDPNQIGDSVGSIPTDASGNFSVPLISLSIDGAENSQGVQRDNSVVHSNVLPGVSLATELTATGLRSQFVIEDRKADHDITMTIAPPDGLNDAAKLVLRKAADGSVKVQFRINKPGEGPTLLDVATIESPWAIDANGRSVRTEYIVHDNKVTQRVMAQRGQVAYPIVADPTLTTDFGELNCGWSSCKWYWTQSATWAINFALSANVDVPFPGDFFAQVIVNLGCTMLGAGIAAVVSSTVAPIYGTVTGAGAGTVVGFLSCALFQSSYVNDSTHHAAAAVDIGGCLRVNHNHLWGIVPFVSFDHVGPDHSRCR